MMKKMIFPAVAALLLVACNGGGSDTVEIDQLRDEAIAIHDEIMPQISAFDRNSVKIDSILSSLSELKAANPNIDTVQVRTDLSALKVRLEGATNAMMDWMTGFDVDPQDKSAAETKSYYEKEVEKVKEMKVTFDEVSKESVEKLAQF
ncbi:transposase [Parapedobacter sp.]